MAYTTIDDSEAHFQVQLYTGNGAANNAITLGGDTDMQPDLVWIKNRDATDSHCLFDALRGATEVMHSDTNDAEATDADTLDSFTSDGFQVDADVKVNTNTEDYVSWNWKANGTGSSNTSGSINTTATSANTTAGFSIMTFTGTGSAATIGHGLGAVPHLVIVKSRDSAGQGWGVYHRSNTAAPETDYLKLDTSAATADSAGYWNDVAPTSTVFTIGDSDDVNKDSATHVAYAWTEKQGFSKFGSYVGNGNANGPFIYTGFRPALVIIKLSSSSKNWYMFDNKRDPINDGTGTYLLPNETSADGTGTALSADFLSNGFKWTGTNSAINGDGNTYVYAAFAYAPFVNSNGVPCNAR